MPEILRSGRVHPASVRHIHQAAGKLRSVKQIRQATLKPPSEIIFDPSEPDLVRHPLPSSIQPKIMPAKMMAYPEVGSQGLSKVLASLRIWQS